MIKKLLFSALVGATMMFTSCDSDPCKDLDGKCGTGTCFEGTCVCDEGYEPDADGICNTQWSTKFVGSYNVVDVCASGSYTYEVAIASTGADKVSISNFAGFQVTGPATVSRANATDVSATQIDYNFTDASSRTFVGSAKISGTTITGSYTVTFPDNTTDACSFTYTAK